MHKPTADIVIIVYAITNPFDNSRLELGLIVVPFGACHHLQSSGDPFAAVPDIELLIVDAGPVDIEHVARAVRTGVGRTSARYADVQLPFGGQIGDQRTRWKAAPVVHVGTDEDHVGGVKSKNSIDTHVAEYEPLSWSKLTDDVEHEFIVTGCRSRF